MQSHVDSTLGVSAEPPIRPIGRRIIAAALALYFVWSAFEVTRALPIFSELFDGLGLELPLPTRVLLAGKLWFLPAVFAVGAVLSVATGLFSLNKRQSRIAYATMALLAVLPVVVALLLNLPLFMLSANLARSH